MNINIVLPRATIFDKDNNLYLDVKDMLLSFYKRGYNMILMSHDTSKHKKLREKIKIETGLDISVFSRSQVREGFSKEEAISHLKTTIVLGSSNEDLYLAATYKLLLINPGWSVVQEEKPLKYGLTINEPNKIVQMLDIIKNQQHWFFKLTIDEKTDLYALTSANNNSATQDESKVIDGFRDFLKKGNRNYYEALFFYFISSVMQSDDLRKIDIWGIMPSSGSSLNPDMFEIKERARYLTARRAKEPLFIRHTPVQKSHYTSSDERMRIGASKHLDSIHINPDYKSKLRGKTICILDDYVTYGSSFEALRNLLLKAGAEKVIFVAIGRFKKGYNGIYQKENYEISGDIFSPMYEYQLITKEQSYGINAIYDVKAKTEVENIYNILNNK